MIVSKAFIFFSILFSLLIIINYYLGTFDAFEWWIGGSVIVFVIGTLFLWFLIEWKVPG